MPSLRTLLPRVRTAVGRLIVRDPNGDPASGTAFHLGDGIFATAEHVIRDREIEHLLMDGTGRVLHVQERITPVDRRSDVALLRTDLPLPHTAIPLGYHFEAWMPETLPLTKVLLLGYPRIPWDGEGVLVATEAEVNAMFPHMHSPHRHLLLSSSAEGGFSGGPVVSEDGTLIGMVVEEVTGQARPTTQGGDGALHQSGYCLAISVEPLVRLIATLPTRPSWLDADVWRQARP